MILVKFKENTIKFEHFPPQVEISIEKEKKGIVVRVIESRDVNGIKFTEFLTLLENNSNFLLGLIDKYNALCKEIEQLNFDFISAIEKMLQKIGGLK